MSSGWVSSIGSAESARQRMPLSVGGTRSANADDRPTHPASSPAPVRLTRGIRWVIFAHASPADGLTAWQCVQPVGDAEGADRNGMNDSFARGKATEQFDWSTRLQPGRNPSAIDHTQIGPICLAHAEPNCVLSGLPVRRTGDDARKRVRDSRSVRVRPRGRVDQEQGNHRGATDTAKSHPRNHSCKSKRWENARTARTSRSECLRARWRSGVSIRPLP